MNLIDFVQNDVRNTTLRNIVNLRQSLLCQPSFIFFSDCVGLFLGKLGLWIKFSLKSKNCIVFSSVAWHSSFARRIKLIVGIRTDKEVERITARRIVTMMTYKHTIRDGSKNKFVSGSMGKLAFFVNRHTTIPPTADSGLPRPTFMQCPNLHLAPKQGLENKVVVFDMFSETILAFFRRAIESHRCECYLQT